MIYFLEQLKEELAVVVNVILKQAVVTPASFVFPPDPSLGDLSLPCFALAKELQTNPVSLAQKICETLSHCLVLKATPAGPYINITFSFETAGRIIREITQQGEKYGQSSIGKKKKVMQEYANGNTHKEYHVGHLRNIAFGDAINRILTVNGYTSIPVSYINDFGIHVAKTLWYYLKTKAKEPFEAKGYFLGQLYTQATTALEANPEARQEVGEMMKAIESRKGEIYKLWKETRQWSLDQFETVNEELGVKFATTFYESDFIDEGLRVIQDLLKKGILVKSEGAIIANLEEYNLGVLVVIRSDGTALYPVADLALTQYKVKKYKLDTCLWVVDIRQGQYLHQLFKVLELAGLQAHLAHLPYEFVKLPSGMMSSRSGNVITYEDLKTEALKRATEEVIRRHSDWSEEKIDNVARILAFGALKFEMVKVSGEKVITFDMDKALQFEGFTAAYIQYTYARIQSLQRKGGKSKTSKTNFQYLKEKKEKEIALFLGRFSEVVKTAGEIYQPSEVARYLYELAQTFNEYYHSTQIIQAEGGEHVKEARLELAKAVGQILENGLELLGVEVVEEM